MKLNPGIQPFAKLSRNKENIIYKGIIDVKSRMLEGYRPVMVQECILWPATT